MLLGYPLHNWARIRKGFLLHNLVERCVGIHEKELAYSF
jgi:hypothetical protein